MKIRSLLIMMRPQNSIMAGIGITIGFIYAGKTLSVDLLLQIVAGMTALGFGNVINDIVDIETDKLSHPNRPLVTGAVSNKEALYFLALLALISLSSGAFVSPIVGVATLVPIGILTLYSLYLKATPFAGNITVSLLIAYTLLYGGLGGNITPLILPALLAMSSNICREILKDLADKEGDAHSGITTTAMVSPQIIRRVIYGGAVATLAFALLPYILGTLGLCYFILILVTVPALTYQWLRAYHNQEYSIATTVLKREMLIGMGAILVDFFCS